MLKPQKSTLWNLLPEVSAACHNIGHDWVVQHLLPMQKTSDFIPGISNESILGTGIDKVPYPGLWLDGRDPNSQ